MTKSNNRKSLNYVSLFSGGGVGLYAFKELGFECILTNEIIERRLNVQKVNKIAKNLSDYLSGDIKDEKIKTLVNKKLKKEKIDLIIATPPCQGMSVANHKKNENDKFRNSLILESINIVKTNKPKIFLFENVRSFLKTLSIDNDGQLKPISEVIELNLSRLYKIESKIINFSNYGAHSNRTRTLVIGSLKSLEEIDPIDLFPDQIKPKTLRELIYKMPRLKKMGEISKKDNLHNFKKYELLMEKWIEKTKEGESAFDQKDKSRIPSRIKDGKIVKIKNKNSDKYKRCTWDKVAPCVHTRNDIIASQSTIHPEDNRVFSIRELMILMNVPKSFKWFAEKSKEIKNIELILKKHEINIRQCLGEGVPTSIFKSIGIKIRESLSVASISLSDLNLIKKNNHITDYLSLKKFILRNFDNYNFYQLCKIREFFNFDKEKNAAFHTRSDVCKKIVTNLPSFKNKKLIRILEPAVGSGNFLPYIFEKFKNKKVEIDLIDLDKNSLEILKILLKKIKISENFKIKFINKNFFDYKISKKYDFIITNPPFGKIKANEINKEIQSISNKILTKNLYALFLYKSLQYAENIAFICPKSFLNTPEYDKLRVELSKYFLRCIHDYGEKGFKGVLIETISIQISRIKKLNSNVKILSFIDGNNFYQNQSLIQDKKMPYWLIYRNQDFEKIAKKLKFNVFEYFRDREITKKITNNRKQGIRVIKSRNIGNLKILNIVQYDTFIKNYKKLKVTDFINQKKIIVPNLTYYPRAAILPNNSICDGSVAILTPKNGYSINKEDLKYFATEEFKYFYSIARNKGTRSLNIDSNSIFFWGIRKDQLKLF